MWWRCSQLLFFLRGNVVTMLPVTLLPTLSMWWRCSQLRFLLRWQCGDGAPGSASCYVGNVVTVLPVTILVTDVWPRPRGVCTYYDYKNCPNPSYTRSKKTFRRWKRGSNGILNEKESATAQFPINKSVRPDRFIEHWTVTQPHCLNEHPGCQTIRAIQFCFTDKILKVSMRSALCWKASGSIN